MEKGVVIYTVTGCPFCARAKKWLQAHDVTFEERDAAKNEHYIEEVFKMTGHGAVPLILIGGQMIVGFDEPKLDAALVKLRQS